MPPNWLQWLVIFAVLALAAWEFVRWFDGR